MEHYLDYKTPPKYNGYKKRARQRFPTETFLTEDQFNKLSNQACFYCGKKGPNGIDRIDNNKGYSFDNCVPCCKHCNYVKGNLSTDDFNRWKERFVSNQIKQLPHN